MSLMNCRVVKRFVDMKMAPSMLSTPSAMCLPVQLRVSVASALFVNGGDQSLALGSLVRMYLFSSRFLPILYRNMFVTKASFNLATFDSPAFSSAYRWSYAKSVAANFRMVSP